MKHALRLRIAAALALGAALAPCGCSNSSSGAVADTAPGAEDVTVPRGDGDTAATDDGVVAPDAGDPVNTFAYLVVDPEILDFGAWTVGQEDTRDVVLENAGNLPLTLMSIHFAQALEEFATNAQQSVIPPGPELNPKLLHIPPPRVCRR